MIKITTPNEVILNVYQESSKAAQEDFQLECLLNDLLAKERDELDEMKAELSTVSYQPQQSSIENILAYSQSFMSSQ